MKFQSFDLLKGIPGDAIDNATFWNWIRMALLKH